MSVSVSNTGDQYNHTGKTIINKQQYKGTIIKKVLFGKQIPRLCSRRSRVCKFLKIIRGPQVVIKGKMEVLQVQNIFMTISPEIP